ncbi:MAG TPA: tRNA(Ile)(2)-agmatinylcytidine synthase [Nitrososphaera sp.]
MQTLHIAFDDTDSRAGRCTTHLAYRVMERLKGMGAELVDYPLLVRLNPNIPWKTRGNGAVCLRVRVHDPAGVMDHVRQAVEEGSAIGNGANPGVAFLIGESVPVELQEFGRRALYDVLSRQMAEKVAAAAGVQYHTFGNGQGLVGSVAAMGLLMTDSDYTFELIAYRKPENCGRPRAVDEEKVVRFTTETYPNTFNNYDRNHRRVLLAPHGPDPVFFGVRGENPEVLMSALRSLEPEEVLDGWMIFRSNQGTNMHLGNELPFIGIKAYTAGCARCKVKTGPRAMQGGHVIFTVEQDGIQMPAAIYEPTGLASVAVKLEPGDLVEIGFGVRKGTTKHPKILNIEYLSVLEVAPVFEPRNPLCRMCGKRMKSEGSSKGYQCDRCKFRDPKGTKVLIPMDRELKAGLYLPTPKAHRHLTKPLQRYGIEKKNFRLEECVARG